MRAAVFIAFTATLVLSSLCQAEHIEPQQLEGKLILQLPLRASQSQAPVAPRPDKLKDIGHFFDGPADENGIFFGEMLCIDTQGRLYFYDPINPKLALLRCVDRNGYEVARWKLPISNASYRAAATPDGYVWLGANNRLLKKDGLPVVVYKFGQAKPIIDWRTKPPFDVSKFVEKTLSKKYFDALSAIEKGEATAWEAKFLGVSQGKIQLELTNEGTGYNPSPQLDGKKTAITIRWTLTSDGKNTLQRDVYKSPTLGTWQELAADGTQWYFAHDYSLKTHKWSKAWLWKKGEQKGQPLFTLNELANPQGWWQKTFSFVKGRQNAPGFDMDGTGKIYLSFWRENAAFAQGEEAVVIFNSQRKPMAYLPWTPSRVYIETWIFPLPDGSGFYRQEKDDKELRIYFYALPKAK